MRIRVVSPWYPDHARPYSGIFVQTQVEALMAAGHDVHVEVPRLYPAPRGRVPAFVLEAMVTSAAGEPGNLFESEGPATYIPSPVSTGSGQMGRVDSFTRTLAMWRSTSELDSEIVHAHLGVPTGRACLALGDSPLVVTEHQSSLDSILADPTSRHAYGEVVEASAAFICVSEVIRALIAERFPGSEAKLETVPNAIDIDSISFRERESVRPSRWLYVGGLFRHKGVVSLLRAFSVYRSEIDPSATLTLVGDGPMRSALERMTVELGIEGCTHFPGAVSHDHVDNHLSAADVMVHLSPYETFGIASLEGIASGLPVVSLRNGGSEAAWGDLEPIAGTLLPVSATPETVAEAVSSLAGEKSRLDLRRARAAIHNRYSTATIAARLGEIYARVTR